MTMTHCLALWPQLQAARALACQTHDTNDDGARQNQELYPHHR